MEQRRCDEGCRHLLAAWLDERGHLGLAEEEKIITTLRTYIGAYQMTRFLDLDDRDARVVTKWSAISDPRWAAPTSISCRSR